MSRRTERIAKVMQQEIGQIVLTRLSDPRIDPARVSVTRVSVQEDLLGAKVYVSVYGADAEQKQALAALKRASGRIRAMLKDRMSIRTMPALTFLTDEQFKGALKTWEIIRQAMDEIHRKEHGSDDGDAAPDDADHADPNDQSRIDGSDEE